MIATQGICSTCTKEADCMHLNLAKQAISQCEEFECSSPVPETAFKPCAIQPDTPKNTYQGLCSDCENSAHCTTPNPEGGIWHCEEYK